MNCLKCGKESGNYKYCEECYNKYQDKSSVDLSEIKGILTRQNWNFGATQKWLKMILLNDLEKLSTEKGLTKIQQKIHKSLLKDIEKDFKNIKDISEELNK